MDGIVLLLSLVIKISLLAGVTYLIMQVMRGRKRNTLLEDIKKADAKMASLRMSLRSKVKKKSQAFKAALSNPQHMDDVLEMHLKEMVELPFEKKEDFQDYMDLSKKINDMIKLANRQLSSESHSNPHEVIDLSLATENTADFMSHDLRNEFAIAKIITDMISVSKIVSRRVANYNNFDRKSKLPSVEPIQFPSMFELQKALKDTSYEKNSSGDNNTSLTSNEKNLSSHDESVNISSQIHKELDQKKSA